MADMDVGSSAYDLIEALKRKCPEYLDLLTAQNDEQFEDALSTLLEKAVSGIEQNKKNFRDLNEEGISAVLVLALNMPGLTATQETNSNGHVDITITADHCTPSRRWLGEAKIWNGPKYHISGLRQLLDRYTTGREGRGLMITYVKQRNIKGIIAKLRQSMDRDRHCDQVSDTTDHTLRWSFISAHAHSCGENLEVGHIGCNLYLESDSRTDDSD